MALQTLTLHLPEALYQQVARRAQQQQHTVEEEVVAAVIATLPEVNDLPAALTQELAQLASLTDAELQQAMHTTLPDSAQAQMQALMLKRQREGLTPGEMQEAERLAQRYDRTMLIRAQAAVLLQERGYRVPLPPPLPAP